MDEVSVSLGLAVVIMAISAGNSLMWSLPVFMAGLFCICLYCHGAKEILELSDKIEDDNPVKVQRARLQVDSRKWLAARLAPKKYSDHITHDVKGGGINFQPQILIQCSSDEGEGFIDVRAAPWSRVPLCSRTNASPFWIMLLLLLGKLDNAMIRVRWRWLVPR